MSRDPEHDAYLRALDDFEELLDNAKANHTGPEAPRHWDCELRDHIIVLRDQHEFSMSARKDQQCKTT